MPPDTATHTAALWLAKARSDLRAVEILTAAIDAPLDVIAFHAQQIAEKALKALHYWGGARFVLGHSLVELLGPLLPQYPQLAPLQEAAQRLDQYYIPTRYPNGLPGGAPFQVYTKTQAAEAVVSAQDFVALVRAAVGPR